MSSTHACGHCLLKMATRDISFSHTTYIVLKAWLGSVRKMPHNGLKLDNHSHLGSHHLQYMPQRSTLAPLHLSLSRTWRQNTPTWATDTTPIEPTRTADRPVAIETQWGAINPQAHHLSDLLALSIRDQNNNKGAGSRILHWFGAAVQVSNKRHVIDVHSSKASRSPTHRPLTFPLHNYLSLHIFH